MLRALSPSLLLLKGTGLVPIRRSHLMLALCCVTASLILHLCTFGYMKGLLMQLQICTREGHKERTHSDRSDGLSSSSSSSSSSQSLLPPTPALVPLTSDQLVSLEEPWKWFERIGEHKDLVAKVQSLRSQLGRPLVILDIGLNIGTASWSIARVCPDCIVYGFEPIPTYFSFAKYKLPKETYPNVHLHNYAVCDHVGKENIWMETGINVGSVTQDGTHAAAVTFFRFLIHLPYLSLSLSLSFCCQLEHVDHRRA